MSIISLILRTLLTELCRLVGGDEGIKYLLQIAVHHIGSTVYCKVQAMIHDVIMIEIIGTDTIAAFTPSDLAFPFFRKQGFFFFPHFSDQSGTEYPESFGLVFQLAPFILTGDHNA